MELKRFVYSVQCTCKWVYKVLPGCYIGFLKWIIINVTPTHDFTLLTSWLSFVISFTHAVHVYMQYLFYLCVAKYMYTCKWHASTQNHLPAFTSPLYSVVNLELSITVLLLSGSIGKEIVTVVVMS